MPNSCHFLHQQQHMLQGTSDHWYQQLLPVMGFGRYEPEADRWLDRYFELIGRARLPLALPG